MTLAEDNLALPLVTHLPAGHLEYVLLAITEEQELSSESTNVFRASTCIMLANISLARASHTVKPKIRKGGQCEDTWLRA